jgi:hypothetical protein
MFLKISEDSERGESIPCTVDQWRNFVPKRWGAMPIKPTTKTAIKNEN